MHFFLATIDSLTLFKTKINFNQMSPYRGGPLFVQYEPNPASPATLVIRVGTPAPTRPNIVAVAPKFVDLYLNIDGNSQIILQSDVSTTYGGGDIDVTATVTQSDTTTRWDNSSVSLSIVERASGPGTSLAPVSFVLVGTSDSTVWNMRWINNPVFLKSPFPSSAEPVPPDDNAPRVLDGGIGVFGPMGLQTP